MKYGKCGFCGERLKKRVQPFITPFYDKQDKQIVVSDVVDYVCAKYPECDYSDFPKDQSNRVKEEINKRRKNEN